MTKKEYLKILDQKLEGIPQKDREEAVMYYSELIDDRIEDGASEEEAVDAMGSADEAVIRILKEMKGFDAKEEKQNKPQKERKSLPWWVIVLLIFASPVLLGFIGSIIGAVAGVLGGVIGIYAAIAALWIAGAASVPGAVMLFVSAKTATGLFLLGAGLASVGIGIIGFILMNRLTALGIKGIKKLVLFLKGLFGRKGESK